jgi:hypothetical protein
VNIAPPATGSASVSFSSWRAVPEVETRLCHPDTAPQEMVTNRIGQSGVANPGARIPGTENPAYVGKSPKPGCWMRIPRIDPTIPAKTSQKLT